MTERLTDEQIDNNAVDAFAVAMKEKLAKKRAEGRGGWHDPKQCTITYLEKLLHEHYRKGDVLDLANFCMMLHQREGRPSQWRLTEPKEFAMAQVCLDLHAALGVKWGDDPYAAISKLANAPRAEPVGVPLVAPSYHSSDCKNIYVVRLEDYTTYCTYATEEIAKLRAERDAAGIMRQALKKISLRKYNDRSTVNQDNAFNKFGKLNAEVCEMFSIADEALLRDAALSESAK